MFQRLSAYAGEKLRLNNPGLADLSDENRPNKLAEKFSELYDNDWTDALESLADTNQTEESQTQDLLQTLQVFVFYFKRRRGTFQCNSKTFLYCK